MVSPEVKSETEKKLAELIKGVHTDKLEGFGVLIRSTDTKTGLHYEIRDYETISLYNELLEFIHTQEDYARQYSHEHVRRLFGNMIHRGLAEGVTKAVAAFYSELDKNRGYRWEVFARLVKIQIMNSKSYQFGDCIVKRSTTEDWKESDIVPDNFSGSPVIITKVVAGDSDRAKEIARQKFQSSLAIFKLYSEWQPKLEGDVKQAKQSFFIRNITKNSTTVNDENVGDLPTDVFLLDDRFYRFLEQNGIHSLSEDTPFARKIKDALYWHYFSEEFDESIEGFLGRIIILETLLKHNDERSDVTSKVCTRGAFLLASTYEKRKGFYNMLKEVYSERSTITHTGNISKSYEGKLIYLSALANQLSSRVLAQVILLCERFDGDFYKFIDALKNEKFKSTERNKLLYD